MRVPKSAPPTPTIVGGVASPSLPAGSALPPPFALHLPASPVGGFGSPFGEKRPCFRTRSHKAKA